MEVPVRDERGDVGDLFLCGLLHLRVFVVLPLSHLVEAADGHVQRGDLLRLLRTRVMRGGVAVAESPSPNKTS